jgi:putative ABC transport system permease protein
VSNSKRLASTDDASRETQRWLNSLLVLVIFAFTSLAVLNTLTTIALQRRRELALLRLAGATRGQIAAMTRWEAAVIVVTGVGLGVAISLATLLPFSRALDTSPYVPPGQAALIVAVTAALALVGLQLPTRIVSRRRASG